MSCNENNCISMVFSMTNEINNSVVAFIRDNMGTLSCPKAFRTGGNGTGLQQVDPLGSQGSIALSSDRKFLFVVNAGSNNISSFRVCQGGLSLIEVVPSGGIFPNSLTINNYNIYVTNAGNPPQSTANVTGFHIDSDGHLSIINGSQRPLSSSDAQPKCIVSRPYNNKLVVSEAVTNNLSVYNVDCNGRLNGPTVTPSNGVGPFGSAYLNNNLLVVSEVGTNALSSYRVMNNGVLDVISGSVLNNQTATCWVSVDPNEHYAYTSNPGSGTITRYRIMNGGTLTVVESIPSTPNRTGSPIDSGIDMYGKNFYVLNGGEGSISVFKIDNNGHLVLLQIYQDTKLPQIGAQGLAIL
ncbi:beta-propeller fold lactonase family protein [Clostridium sp. CF011]|uniref:lactonase family protein n=1 Tax=unclassified Clostridium TaxID=2614128 RepID=UPI001C0B5AB0|nr:MULTISPECIES: beta-propeller fold lactonase family protein [unclassified Clostridium]MBU3091694.1 beta-propeller fold lactonase family protein [Clostridium sp. CF011]MBW9144805.1 beta-propeller fold lactonase family protein [Clostridium sp. CM027]UVE40448.1 beta-propeller fold lactonase family protein [Clostridium sp. CM027]WAG69405.1 beta-propeller fold lactonase family protein [Clostridium sp. CF011]